MPRRDTKSASQQLKLPLLAVSAAMMLALPTASLALVGFGLADTSEEAEALDLFTPASVDPALAARVADKAREKGLRFTPAGVNPALRGGTVTVAVRVDDDTAKAITIRDANDAVPGLGQGVGGLQTSRFDLGIARGYQSFARTVELPASVRELSVPDLSEFAPLESSLESEPGRLQPRIELEDERLAGRSVNTLDDLGAQTVDLGGSFRITPGVDVTAGVRLSQERERLGPLTNSVQDSQAVYVGTQIKF
ncbi:MAG: hypothetical protein AAFR64_06950 [Pseudomonadota bacterium]